FPPKNPNKKDLSSGGPEPGIPVFSLAQLNGVVIIGASRNTIGQSKKIAGSAANTINGNVEVGVYVTNRDFDGRVFSTPVGNVVSGNQVRDDGLFGILLFNAPNNSIRPFTSQSRALIRNTIRGNRVPFRNFVGAFDSSTSLPIARKTKAGGHGTK